MNNLGTDRSHCNTVIEESVTVLNIPLPAMAYLEGNFHSSYSIPYISKLHQKPIIHVFLFMWNWNTWEMKGLKRKTRQTVFMDLNECIL